MQTAKGVMITRWSCAAAAVASSPHRPSRSARSAGNGWPGRRPPPSTSRRHYRRPPRLQTLPTVALSPCCSPTCPASRRSSERLDPEDVRAFQNALFADAGARRSTRFDGFVEKFVGDAVMAVFGAPVAHEDDPERALAAALDDAARHRRAQRAVGRAPRPRGARCTSACTPARSSPAASAAAAGGSLRGDRRHREHRVAPAVGGRAGHDAGLRRDPRADAPSLRLRAGGQARRCAAGAAR